MKIGIIGTGRVGTALGKAFKQAGYELTGVVSRNREHANCCMRVVGCKHWSSEPQDLINKSDIILIAVPDSQIENVVKKLTSLQGINPCATGRKDSSPESSSGLLRMTKVGVELASTLKEKQPQGIATTLHKLILVHTSGVIPSNILRVKHSLSMHPISSFAGGELPQGTYFGIEGDIEAGKKLVKSIGGIPIVISPEHKALYHAGLNFGAAYILTLLEKGCKLLDSSGIKEPEKIMLSLANSTLENAKKFGIKNSFTGAIERRDTKIVEDEIKAIKEMSSENLEIYKMLVRETQKLTKK